MAEPETFSHPALSATAPAWRPGDERPDIASMLRVNQAGEYGATRIYAGQLAVLGDHHAASGTIGRMAAQEQAHLAHFDDLIARRGVRPTLLQPAWSIAGQALGAVTALISPQAAMACTAAIEDEIDEHYSQQLAALGEEEPDLARTIHAFRADEQEHRETAIAAGAEEAVAYPLLYSAIRAGCRLAIALSKRI